MGKLIEFGCLLRKIKKFKWRKLFCWHIFPLPEDRVIESVYEIVLYLFLLFGCCFLYDRFNKIDYRNILVEAECLDNHFKVYGDSLISRTPTLDVEYKIPMTNVDTIKSKYAGKNLILSFSYLCESCNPIDSLFIDFYSVTDSLRNQIKVNGENDVVNNIRDKYKLRYKDYRNLKSLLTNYETYRVSNDSLRAVYDSISSLETREPKNKPLFYYDCKHNIINKSQFTKYHIIKEEGGALLGDNGIGLATGYWKSYLSNNYLGQKGFVSETASSIIIKDEKGISLGSPKWYVLYDISQAYYDIRLNVNTIEAITLEFNFLGATKFSNMIPEPDEITMSSIKFYNPIKIMNIKSNGLKFHAKFVELEGRQNFRLFCLSALMSALTTIILVFMVLALFKLSRYKKWLS
ncbi:MAG: hypothetical protein IJ614_05010 [Prevotella sp.]|nr:hypothetical protein [Prevotella sp.]